MPSLSRNTVLLAARTCVSVVIGLVTSRLVLMALGAEGYGLYAVTASLVALFDFVNQSMAGASLRFMSYELGRGGSLRRVFRASLRVQLVLATCFVVMAETVGLWYVNARLNVGAESLPTVNFVYQMVILAAVFSLLKTPALSLLMARERMSAYAGLEIATAALRLCLVIGLCYGLAGGGIDGYSVLIAAVSLVSAAAFATVALRDSSLRVPAAGSEADRLGLWGLLRFSVLDLAGNMAVIFNTQGIMLAVNAVAGLAANAALGLANAVVVPVLTLTASVGMAVRPRLIKLYAAGDKAGVRRLLVGSARVAALTYMALAFPLIFNMRCVLEMWLGDYPPALPGMLAVLLAVNIFVVLKDVFVIVVHASGRIASLSFGTGAIYICGPFAVYGLCRAGVAPAASLWALGAVFAAVLGVTLCLASRRLGRGSLGELSTGVMLYVALVAAAGCVLFAVLGQLMPAGLLRLLVGVALSAAVFGLPLSAVSRGWRVRGRGSL